MKKGQTTNHLSINKPPAHAPTRQRAGKPVLRRKDIIALQNAGISLRKIGKICNVSGQTILNRISYKPQLAKNSKIIKKHLADPTMNEAGQIILKYCVANNLRLGDGLARLGFAPGHFYYIKNDQIKTKWVKVPLLDYLKEKIEE